MCIGTPPNSPSHFPSAGLWSIVGQWRRDKPRVIARVPLSKQSCGWKIQQKAPITVCVIFQCRNNLSLSYNSQFTQGRCAWQPSIREPPDPVWLVVKGIKTAFYSCLKCCWNPRGEWIINIHIYHWVSSWIIACWETPVREQRARIVLQHSLLSLFLLFIFCYELDSNLLFWILITAQWCDPSEVAKPPNATAAAQIRSMNTDVFANQYPGKWVERLVLTHRDA